MRFSDMYIPKFTRFAGAKNKILLMRPPGCDVYVGADSIYADAKNKILSIRYRARNPPKYL